MTNLLEGIKGMFTDAIIDKTSNLIGLQSNATRSALDTFLPAIIGRVSNMGSTSTGAKGLLDIFKSKNLGDISDLGSILGDSKKSNSLLSTGGDLLNFLFKGNVDSILGKLVGMTGIKKAGGSMLLKFLAPVILNKLAGLVFKNKWGADKLSSYLSNQKSLLPAKFAAFGMPEGSSASFTNTSSSSKKESGGSNGGGMGWLKWLLLPLLALLAFYLFNKKGCNSSASGDTTKTEVKADDSHAGHDHSGHNHAGHDHAGHNHDGHDHAGHDHAGHNHGNTGNATNTSNNGISIDWSKVDYNGLTLGANGDILTKDGKIAVSSNGYALDANGNLINPSTGNIIIEKAKISTSFLDRLKKMLGKYAGVKLSTDANGNLVDNTGKIIYKKGEFEVKNGYYYDKAGNKLGRFWEKLVKAIKDGAKSVTDAAEKSVEQMTTFFQDLIAKKPNAKTSYSLNNITFHPENQKITNFTKSEVMGLAEALKANPSNKVNINVFTNDGGNKKANETLSLTRAKVIKQMLTALGVKDSQLSLNGMGSSDAAKAAANKIEILAK